MAIEILDRNEPSPYRPRSKGRRGELIGLALTSTQAEEIRAPIAQYLASSSTASAISEGLFGSIPPVDPFKPRAKTIGRESVGGQLPNLQSAVDRNLSDSNITISGWLAEVIAELDQINQEAEEEGLQLSTQSNKRIAVNILKNLALATILAPAVYLTQNGAIAILFQNRDTQSAVLILCEADGGGACFSTIAGKKRRARYDDSSDLPDAFVISQLRLLSLK